MRNENRGNDGGTATADLPITGATKDLTTGTRLWPMVDLEFATTPLCPPLPATNIPMLNTAPSPFVALPPATPSMSISSPYPSIPMDESANPSLQSTPAPPPFTAPDDCGTDPTFGPTTTPAPL